MENYICKDAGGDAPWLNLPDIPSEEEIGWLVDGQFCVPKIVVFKNRLEGPFVDKVEYLKIHADLIRNDGIYPLREAVDEFRLSPSMVESDTSGSTRIYDDVYILGLTAARDGLALKIEFSTRRAQRLIRWPYSKRLKTGTLVALTPASDKFQTKCIVGVVASRLLSALEVRYPEKPQLHIYLGNANQLEVDPQQEFIMVEALVGYWEAYRHTYQALKKLHYETFPMSKHIISLLPPAQPPQYRIDHPNLDMSSAARNNHHLVRNCNILDAGLPQFACGGSIQAGSSDLTSTTNAETATSDLDASQLDALHRILANRLAIVQGPPGTGKTYVSVVAIQILLENRKPSDPPIIVTAQTNHALDQLLRLIGKFEPEFVRLGGQTTDKEFIKPRTLFEVRQQEKVKPNSVLKRAVAELKALEKNLEHLLEPFTSAEPISPDTCYKYGLISEKQCDSILSAESPMVGPAIDKASQMEIWCDNGIAPMKKKQGFSGFHEYEEFEEFEKLDEEDLEAIDDEDEKFEALRGRFYGFHDGFVGKQTTEVPDNVIKKLLERYDDLNDVAAAYRPAMYNYFRRSVSAAITAEIRKFGRQAQNLANSFKIGRWERDYEVLRRSTKIIGLTTTGLSKYRGLISCLKPKIVLIEEAAETLEAYVAAACVESLEHLILVGDHQQLRGHCNHPDFEGDPVHFDMSMFERLVRNGMPFTQLKSQRRMRPDIRELINPIYPELIDHTSVSERADVPGMGGLNVQFFHHKWQESNDDTMSKQNDLEARMVVAFFAYLVYNGLLPKQITVLTFYNGQVKILRKAFRRDPILMGHNINVHTVDSYQGEENDIVILSLVRNNNRNQIGFVNNMNRACVSLSRARRGFYMLGNAGMLANANPKWREILMVLQGKELIQTHLPLRCVRHARVVRTEIYTDFENLNGGCDEPCEQVRSCGHPCGLKCHPFACDEARCHMECEVIMRCGHACTRGCGIKPCQCELCIRPSENSIALPAKPADRSGEFCTVPAATPEVVEQSKKAWANFAAGGHKKADAEAMEMLEMEAKQPVRPTETIELQRRSGNVGRSQQPASSSLNDLQSLTIHDVPTWPPGGTPNTGNATAFPPLSSTIASHSNSKVAQPDAAQLASTEIGRSIGIRPTDAFPSRVPPPTASAPAPPVVYNAPIRPRLSSIDLPPDSSEWEPRSAPTAPLPPPPPPQQSTPLQPAIPQSSKIWRDPHPGGDPLIDLTTTWGSAEDVVPPPANDALNFPTLPLGTAPTPPGGRGRGNAGRAGTVRAALTGPAWTPPAPTPPAVSGAGGAGRGAAGAGGGTRGRGNGGGLGFADGQRGQKKVWRSKYFPGGGGERGGGKGT